MTEENEPPESSPIRQSLAWIAIDTNLPRHPKVYALNAELGIKNAHHLLVDLWCWAGSTCPDGNLENIPDSVIAQSAGWHDDASRFVSALTSSGLLDSGRRLHNWYQRQLARLDKNKRRQQEYRDRQKGDGHVTVTDALRNAPTHIRTNASTQASTSARGALPAKPGRIGGWQIDKPRTADELVETAIGQKLAKRYPMLDGKTGRPSLAEIVGFVMSWDGYSRWQWPHGVESNLMTYVGREAQKYRIAYEREQNPNQQPGRADPRQTTPSGEAEKTRKMLAERQRLMDETHGPNR